MYRTDFFSREKDVQVAHWGQNRLNSAENISINNNGTVSITNFDSSDLQDGDVIVGNETDRLLLKFEENRKKSLKWNKCQLNVFLT